MAAKGGGAWKVAYADFVTAMMAFFLVMWICGQDQSLKRAVSHYFQDPFSASKVGDSKQPNRKGSFSDYVTTGSVPTAEHVAGGRGRNSFTQDETSMATKLVNNWIQMDDTAKAYWRDQAESQRQAARRSKDPTATVESVEKAAIERLSKQLRAEFIRSIPDVPAGVHQGLLFEVVAGVNWTEIAEDLLTN